MPKTLDVEGSAALLGRLAAQWPSSASAISAVSVTLGLAQLAAKAIFFAVPTGASRV